MTSLIRRGGGWQSNFGQGNWFGVLGISRVEMCDGLWPGITRKTSPCLRFVFGRVTLPAGTTYMVFTFVCTTQRTFQSAGQGSKSKTVRS